MYMANQTAKDPLTKAKRKVAKAQNRYMKAVAKGERQIRNVRAEVDESIARAKAEFEMRAGQLAEIEQEVARKDAAAANAEEAATRVAKAQQKRPRNKAAPRTPAEAAGAVAAASATAAKPAPEIVAANGNSSDTGAHVLTNRSTKAVGKSSSSTRVPRTRKASGSDTTGK
jgi:hypothetical protein